MKYWNRVTSLSSSGRIVLVGLLALVVCVISSAFFGGSLVGDP